MSGGISPHIALAPSIGSRSEPESDRSSFHSLLSLYKEGMLGPWSEIYIGVSLQYLPNFLKNKRERNFV